MISTPNPTNYRERRKRQDAQRAQGQDPDCGRAACRNRAAPAFVNKGTPLLYCADCAALINKYTPGLCSPEKS